MTLEPDAMIPLSEPIFLVLVSLANGPKHGYAILKDVEDVSAGRVRLSTGTLYGGLQRLLDQKLIARSPDPEPDSGDRPRHPYALTELGRRVVAAESRRLESLVQIARMRTLPSDG